MGAGGMIGMFAGARMRRFVPATSIKWLLAVVLIFTGSRYALGLLF
jgi:uncharacterized membrane protein YfcA